MSVLWDLWRSIVRPSLSNMGDLVIKSIVWNVWLARNDRIFSANAMPTHVLILKVDHMLLSWFSSVTEGTKEKLADSMTIHRSLEFLGPRVVNSGGVPTSEEVQDLGTS